MQEEAGQLFIKSWSRVEFVVNNIDVIKIYYKIIKREGSMIRKGLK